jgi:predicted dehydrogenase
MILPGSPRCRTTRRQFLECSLVAAGSLALPAFIPGRVLGRDGAVAPSNRVVLGQIGVGPRGRHDLDCFLAQPDVQFVAVCDVQAARRDAVKAMVDARYGNKDCTSHRDMFDLFGRSDIDALVIATGDHWHALGSILAVKAGKHVYSEKPCGLTIALCQALDDTVRRYGRVFQAGTQRRTVANFQAAIRLAQSGKLGKLKSLHASIYQLGAVNYGWLPAEPEPPRDVVDWDRWLGPAPWRPYNHAYVEGQWRGYFDFDSGGRLLDWGAHTVDLCQWANRADDTMPIEYERQGNRIRARYANGVELVMRPDGWLGLGTCPVRFEGEDGWVETGDSGKVLVHPAALRRELQLVGELGGLSAGPNVRNFLDCIKSGDLPASHSGVMRHSHIACHAAALAWQLGRKLTFDPGKEAFVGDEEANRLRSRALREPWHV